ncbi:MAG: EamA family transporter [Minisyncoccia bacterium]
MTLYIVLYLIFSISGLILMKKGLMNTSINGISGLVKSFFNIQFLLAHWQFILGAMCYILSFLTWMFLLSKKELSLIYPLTVSIVYIAIMISSVLIFKEQFTLYKIIGVVLIGLGILFLIK